MLFMNEYEIESAVMDLDSEETPNLAAAAQTLERLMEWTNRNSDGWAYWPKPCRAAKRLQETLSEAAPKARYGRYSGDLEDITAAQLRSLLAPVKAFLTRQGVDHAEILG